MKKVNKERHKVRVSISVDPKELAIIKDRAKKGFGGNVSLYLRTVGTK